MFVRIASSEGVSVDVVAGDKDWAKPAQRWKANALLKFAKDYNSAYPSSRLRGFQFDVEPYLLPEYEGNKAPVLLDFVSFVDEMAISSLNSGLRLSFVIPHFYDKDQKWTPSIAYNGRTEYTFTHILNILSKVPDSNILIMAYRNFAEGDNGVIMLSKPELDEASMMIVGNTKIIIAQETGDVSPNYVTYFGTSLSYMNGELTKINSTFSASSAFGGLATHHIVPFFDLAR